MKNIPNTVQICTLNPDLICCAAENLCPPRTSPCSSCLYSVSSAPASIHRGAHSIRLCHSHTAGACAIPNETLVLVLSNIMLWYGHHLIAPVIMSGGASVASCLGLRNPATVNVKVLITLGD